MGTKGSCNLMLNYRSCEWHQRALSQSTMDEGRTCLKDFMAALLRDQPARVQ
jgi:hypothetical protein